LIQVIAKRKGAASGKGEGRPASAGKGGGIETKKVVAEREGSERGAET